MEESLLKIVLLIASLGIILSGFIFGFIWLLVRRSRPRLSGHIQANNLKSEVAIFRDAAGIPDILAADRTDAGEATPGGAVSQVPAGV